MRPTGGKKYKVLGKQAQGKLNPFKGAAAKAKCYLDGDADCLRIVEVASAEAVQAK